MAQVTVAKVQETLELVFSRLDALFERPAGELRHRPDRPEAWSLAEHLEHVGLANRFLLLTIGKGCRTALRRARHTPVPEAESDLERLAAIADPDAFPWAPPAHMVPTGSPQLEEVRAQLRGQRRECLELLASLAGGEGRLCTVWMSVHGLGRLDLYQWLYFLAQHGRYHLELMARLPGREESSPNEE